MKFKFFLTSFIGSLIIPYFLFSINKIDKIKLISYEFAVEGFNILKNSCSQDHEFQCEEIILNEEIIKKKLARICFYHFKNDVDDVKFNKMQSKSAGKFLREQAASNISYNSILFLTLEYPDHFGDLTVLVTENDIETAFKQIINKILNKNLFNKSRNRKINFRDKVTRLILGFLN